MMPMHGHEAAACEVAQLGWWHGGFATRSAIVVDQSSIACVVEIVPGTQAIWSVLSIATDSAVDQSRVYFFELFVPETQSIHDTRTEAFEHNIGLAHEAEEDFMPCLRFQVEGHAALIAVDGDEVEAHTSR